jgi:hypothetical protein
MGIKDKVVDLIKGVTDEGIGQLVQRYLPAVLIASLTAGFTLGYQAGKANGNSDLIAYMQSEKQKEIEAQQEFNKKFFQGPKAKW